MKYNFEEELEKNAGSSETSYADENYRIVDGNNNIVRILTPGAYYGLHFFGKGVKPKTCYGKDKGCPIRDTEDKYEHGKVAARYVCFVLDRADGKVKTAFFPYSVIKQVSDLQKNPDYSFDEVPMPYDIRITFKPDEAPANKYKVDVKPKGEDITEEQNADLAEKFQKASPDQIVEKMKAKQLKADTESGAVLSPQKLAEESSTRQEEYNEEVKEKMKNAPKAEPKVEYPENEIDPADIPF